MVRQEVTQGNGKENHWGIQGVHQAEFYFRSGVSKRFCKEPGSKYFRF